MIQYLKRMREKFKTEYQFLRKRGIIKILALSIAVTVFVFILKVILAVSILVFFGRI